MREYKVIYRGNLPHIQPKDGIFFITFCLHGSLPKHVIAQLQKERDTMIEQAREQGKSEEEIGDIIRNARELYFGKFDKLLDHPKSGPTWLKQPEVAEGVINSLQFLHQRNDFQLICYCIMSNHVHLIGHKITRPLYAIMQSLKTHTGKVCNRLIGRTGESFWQREYFDRDIRNETELIDKIQYVLNNPVAAKLVTSWKEYPYTWLNPIYE